MAEKMVSEAEDNVKGLQLVHVHLDCIYEYVHDLHTPLLKGGR